MGLDHRALPLTRGQLDIWLAHETGHSVTEWQLGVLARLDGEIQRDALERAIRHVMQEAEPARAVIVEDAIHRTDAAEGDKIRLLVLWNDMSERKPGMKLLHFSVL